MVGLDGPGTGGRVPLVDISTYCVRGLYSALRSESKCRSFAYAPDKLRGLPSSNVDLSAADISADRLAAAVAVASEVFRTKHEPPATASCELLPDSRLSPLDARRFKPDLAPALSQQHR